MNKFILIIAAMGVALLPIKSSAQQNKFDSTGNVGIGTLSPIYRLSIETSDTTVANMVRLEHKGLNNSLIFMGTAPATYPVTLQRKANVLESYTDLHISAANTGKIYFETGRTGTTAPIRMTLDNVGLGIGTTTPQAKLAVNGDVFAKRVKVTQTGWPDYVFHEGYQLPSLQDVERYIKANQHLQDIPAAAEIEKEGQDLGEMNKKLLQKVEELTLYMIEQQKQIEAQNKRIRQLEQTVGQQ